MRKKIIIVKPKTLSSKDKEKLSDNGNVVVEHPSPESVRILNQNDSVEYTYIKCLNCGDRIYMTTDRIEALKKSHVSYYCPQGHGQYYK